MFQQTTKFILPVISGIKLYVYCIFAACLYIGGELDFATVDRNAVLLLQRLRYIF